MHASHSLLQNGRPVRYAGNTVFPNGSVSVEFEAVAGDKLEINLDKDSTEEFLLTVNGRSAAVKTPERQWLLLIAEKGKISVKISKSGKDYAAIRSIALLQ